MKRLIYISILTIKKSFILVAIQKLYHHFLGITDIIQKWDHVFHSLEDDHEDLECIFSCESSL